MDLDKIAVISIEPGSHYEPYMPKTLAIALPGGLVESWRVRIPTRDSENRARDPDLRRGLSIKYRQLRWFTPQEIVGRLTRIIRGRTLYAEDCYAATWHLRHLCEAAGWLYEEHLDVHSLHDLFHELCENDGDWPKRVRAALEAMTPANNASAVEARRHWEILESLAEVP